MRPFSTDTTDIAALRGARDAAREAGDETHARALERAIAFHTRVQREQAAGVASPVAPWMG